MCQLSIVLRGQIFPIIIKKELPVHYLREWCACIFLLCLIYRPKERGLPSLSAHTSSAKILAFSQLLSWGPQCVLLGNTEHLSR